MNRPTLTRPSMPVPDPLPAELLAYPFRLRAEQYGLQRRDRVLAYTRMLANSKLIPPSVLARTLGIKRAVVMGWIRHGYVRAFQLPLRLSSMAGKEVGGDWVITRASVVEFLKSAQADRQILWDLGFHEEARWKLIVVSRLLRGRRAFIPAILERAQKQGWRVVFADSMLLAGSSLPAEVVLFDHEIMGPGECHAAAQHLFETYSGTTCLALLDPGEPYQRPIYYARVWQPELPKNFPELFVRVLKELQEVRNDVC